MKTIKGRMDSVRLCQRMGEKIPYSWCEDAFDDITTLEAQLEICVIALKKIKNTRATDFSHCKRGKIAREALKRIEEVGK